MTKLHLDSLGAGDTQIGWLASIAQCFGWNSHRDVLFRSLGGLAAVTIVVTGAAQAVVETPEDDSDESPVIMSVFAVDGSRDTGYRATNSISGTSLNTPIQSLPMPVEVITAEFVDDLKATDFKEALRYTSGVFTEQFSESSGTNSTGANTSFSAERSPSTRGGLGDVFSNAINIRGFNVQFQNRLGFRVGGTVSQFGVTLGGILDSLNYERLEVVRGPSSLLYGIGVLSGIANIIPARPQAEFEGSASTMWGNHGLRRHTFEFSGPVDASWIPGELRYRFGMANEERKDWTDFRTKDLDYYVAQLEYFPTSKIDLFLEYQYGDTRIGGTGSQFVYDYLGANAFGTDRRNVFHEQFNWSRDLGGAGPESRITGPDTYQARTEWNALANLDVQLFEGLTLSVGGYWGAQDTQDFDVKVQSINNRDSTIFVKQNIPNGTGGVRTLFQHVPENLITSFSNPPIPGFADSTDFKTVRYYWVKEPRHGEFAQYRIRANYEFKTPFIGGEATHNLLAGFHSIEDKIDYAQGTELIPRLFLPVNLVGNNAGSEPNGDDAIVFRSISDTDPIRYNGELISQPGLNYYHTDIWYRGTYAIYQGRYLDDRLMVIAGLRHDEYQGRDSEYDRMNGDRGLIINPDNETFGFKSSIDSFERPIRVDSQTFAASYEVTRGLSVYALAAEGVSPNTGALDGNDDSITAESSLSKEIGLKWSLFDDKLSGTLSVYEIERDNAIWNFAAAPRPSSWLGGSNRSNRGNRALEDFDPSEIANGLATINYGVDSSYFNPADLKVDPVTKQYRDGIVGVESIHNDTATPQLIVFLDYAKLDQSGFREVIERAYADVQRSRNLHGDDIDPIFYSRVKGTYNGTNASNNVGANVTFGDRARGADMQLMYSPVPNWQMIFNYAHTTRRVTKPFDLVPAQDQLSGAVFGTEYDMWVRVLGREAFGIKAEDTDGNGVVDKVTYNDAAIQSGDIHADSATGGIEGASLFFGAEDQASFWNKYTFNAGVLNHLSVLLGVRYTGPQTTAVKIGNANLAENLYPTPPTEAQYTVDTGLQYLLRRERLTWRFSLNVYNLLDDQKLYSEAAYENAATGGTELRRSQVYVPPRSYRLSVGLDF